MSDFECFIVAFIPVFSFFFGMWLIDDLSKRRDIKFHDIFVYGEICSFIENNKMDSFFVNSFLNKVKYSIGEKPNCFKEYLREPNRELSKENLYYLFATLIKKDVFTYQEISCLIFLTSISEYPEELENSKEIIDYILQEHISWIDYENFKELVINKKFIIRLQSYLDNKWDKWDGVILVYKQSKLSIKLFGNKKDLYKKTFTF